MTTMLAEAARLAGVALHTPVDVGEYKNVPVAAGNTMVMYIPDTEEAGEMLTGLNLGNTDAIIAVNRLSDEQQAFSRAIRMLPPGAAVPANLPIYRLLSNYEPAGELCDPEKLPEPADAVDVGSEGEDLEFATKALQSCCTPEEKVMTDMDTELFEQLPSRLVLVIEPTAVCARMVEYELEVGVSAVAGSMGVKARCGPTSTALLLHRRTSAEACGLTPARPACSGGWGAARRVGHL